MTFRDLHRVTGLTYSGTLYHYRRLKAEGLVTNDPHTERTIRLTPAGNELVRQMRGAISWQPSH